LPVRPDPDGIPGFRQRLKQAGILSARITAMISEKNPL
jgi:hypothetical protein